MQLPFKKTHLKIKKKVDIDIFNEKDLVFLTLTVDGARKLMPNEYYSIAYGDEEDDDGYEVEREEEFYDN
jgi:hypothetical protein